MPDSEFPDRRLWNNHLLASQMIRPSPHYLKNVLSWGSKSERFDYIRGLEKNDITNKNITSKVQQSFLDVILLVSLL